MRSFTLQQKVGQLFFIGISGSEIDYATRQLLSAVSPGGICLFARNIKTPEQTRSLVDEIRRISAAEPFLSIDQEGGSVDRLRRLIAPMPAASKLRTSDDAKELAGIIGESLRLLGLNMDFAPVVDVITDAREVATNGLFSRAFGRSEHEVADLAGKFLEELQNHGIIGCLKHFPGIGASVVDSHEHLPQVEIDDSEFESVDLFPYQTLLAEASPQMVMIGHAAYPRLKLQESDIDGRLLPSSLSKKFVTDLLRDELGFSGVAITDDLEMGAIVRNYGMGEACKMALIAGNDMLAICAKESAVREGFQAVCEAVESGELLESRLDESLKRIENLRAKLSTPLEFSPEKFGSISKKIQALSSRLTQ